jgi:hypothetical protein
VELQDSAYPFHDWNERIAAECYAPNAASRILDPDGRIIDIVNNYSMISFDFGPTLLSWMERHSPETYQAIIEADRSSMERFSGHGSAIAQAYNHMIMPLANKRDKYTQILWGIKDFEYRFNRLPEGMWLPETAVDLETLDILAGFGITFTILSPRQARRFRRINDEHWHDVSDTGIDSTTPYICRLPSGRTINIFFYNAPITHDIAFGDLLKSGDAFAKRLYDAFPSGTEWPPFVHIATDGETFGHHHRGGEMALTYCLYLIESGDIAKLTNYGEYLERHSPLWEVEIHENSSWSCGHGVERWRDNCGCNTGLNLGWTQAWRRPLRDGLDMLRDSISSLYEEEAGRYMKDPWVARDEYISIIMNRSEDVLEGFFNRHAIGSLTGDERVRVIKLLEMQRNAMLMYTSCGWFFDDISGIETVQVMQYASRVMQLAEDLHNISLEKDFIETLRRAPSNRLRDGAEVYERFVSPVSLDLLRVGAHYAITSVFEEYPEEAAIYCYKARGEIYDIKEAGKQRLITGKTTITSRITLEQRVLSFAVLHLGDHNVNAGVMDFVSDDAYTVMRDALFSAFETGDIAEVIRGIDNFFGENTYSLRHLFKDQQRRIATQLLRMTYEGIDALYRQIYENNYTIMNFFQSLNIPVPKSFIRAAEHVINMELKGLFETGNIDMERLSYLVSEVKKWSLECDFEAIGYMASRKIESMMKELSENYEDIEYIKVIEEVIRLLAPLPLTLNLYKAQNIYFSIGRSMISEMKKRAEEGQVSSKMWLEDFRRLGHYLHVRVD